MHNGFSLRPCTMVFRHVHAQWFFVTSMHNGFSLCPCTMVFRYVHAKWFFVISMQNGFSLCPCKMVFRYVHAQWFFVTSMQNGFSSRPCKMVFRHVHAKWFFVTSMYTSCPRFPVGNDLTSLRRRLISKQGKHCYTNCSKSNIVHTKYMQLPFLGFELGRTKLWHFLSLQKIWGQVKTYATITANLHTNWSQMLSFRNQEFVNYVLLLLY
jgi:hypothetical protein